MLPWIEIKYLAHSLPCKPGAGMVNPASGASVWGVERVDEVGRKIALALLMMGSLVVSEAWAQKFEIAPLAGLRSGGSFNAETSEPTKITVESGAAYGFVVGFGLDQSWQIELIWSRTETEIAERPPDFASPATRLFDAKVDLYHVNLLWQYGLAHERFRPFAFGGLGATHIMPEEGFSTETRFSLDFGGGIKFFFVDNLGIRLQARVVPTLMQSDSGILCIPHRPCYRVYENELLLQGELTFALVLRIR